MQTIKKFFILLLVLCMTTNVYANTIFKDVSNDFWAINYINYVYNNGLMVGDTSGNFRPNDYVSKFEMAKILARIAGYKIKNATDAETTYYKKTYDKNKELLDKYSAKFKKWNKMSDKELAYLLEKQVMTVDDLNKFVIITTDGVEIVRDLLREEIAMFMVKAIGKNEEAKSSSYTYKYSDDSEFNQTYKPYIYYLQEKKIFTPDATNKFKPKDKVTRAQMATILEKISKLDDSNSVNLGIDDTPLGSIDDIDNTNVVDIVRIQGTIEKYLPQVNAIEVVLDDSTKDFYKLSAKVSIYIDGFVKTPDDLEEGQSFTAILYDNEIISLTADLNSKPNNNIIDKEPESTTKDTAYANITDVKDTQNIVSFRISTSKINGDIEFVNKTLSLSSNAKITRNSSTEQLKNLKIGDFVKVGFGDKIESIDAEKSDLNIKGELIAKRYDSNSQTPVFIIKSDNIEYAVEGNKDSSYVRKSIGTTDWKNILIGDKITLSTSYGTVISMVAEGEIKYVEGIVEDLFISKERSTITLKSSTDIINTYSVVSNTINLYEIELGSKIKLKLDSREAIGFTSVNNAIIDGIVEKYTTSNSSVKVNDNFDNVVKDVFLTRLTTVYDSNSGKNVDTTFLASGKHIFVVLESNKSNRAKSIIILN